MTAATEKGVWKRLSPARRFMIDMLHFARQVPSIPVARTMNLAAVAEARRAAEPRPSWTAIFMRSYGLVSSRHPRLRQALVRWPWPHLYEHPISVCGMPIEREMDGEHVLVPTQIRSPEFQSLVAIDGHLQRYKTVPIADIGYFRMALRMGRLPQFVRRFLWWHTLHCSGYKRAKRLGTFGLSSYGRLGAEQIHPIGPLTTLLTFGPISDGGEVVVKIVYDHRVIDGADVARCLEDLERTLTSVLVAELDAMRRAGLQPGQSTARPQAA